MAGRCTAPSPARLASRVLQAGGRTASVPARGQQAGEASAAFFYFYIFQNHFLQKYIFGFIIYRFIPLPPGCVAAGPLPPSCRAVGTLM